MRKQCPIPGCNWVCNYENMYDSKCFWVRHLSWRHKRTFGLEWVTKGPACPCGYAYRGYPSTSGTEDVDLYDHIQQCEQMQSLFVVVAMVGLGDPNAI